MQVFAVGPLCFLILLAMVRKQNALFHFLVIVVSTCELYGGWMTFCPEWLIGRRCFAYVCCLLMIHAGSPSLNTSNPKYLWLYLVYVLLLVLLCSLIAVAQVLQRPLGGYPCLSDLALVARTQGTCCCMLFVRWLLIAVCVQAGFDALAKQRAQSKGK